MLWMVLASLTALAADPPPPSYVICKLHGNVRAVRTDLDAQGVCHTIYSKDGKTNTVGSGKNKASCSNFLHNIKVNLEKSGWSCRDVQVSGISGDGG